MGALYNQGEKKVRAGVYRRYTTNDTSIVVGADDGTVAVVLGSDWGPVGTATKITSITSLEEIYGSSEKVKKTAERCLNIGANALVVVRAGAGGTKGTYAVKNSTSAEAATLTTKYDSNRAFSVTIQNKLGDSGMKEFIVYEDTKVIEKINFLSGTGEIAAFVEAVNEKSTIFNAVAAEGATGTIADDIDQKAITPGTNPTIDTEAYSNAFTVLEAYRFNVLCVDSNDTAVHATLQAFVSRMKANGGLMIAVIGEPTSVELSTRYEHAAAFNDECIVYVGGSGVDNDGNTVEGYEAAAIVAGAIASTPSSESIVHKILSGLNSVKEKLTDSQHIQAINNGCVMFSESMDGSVWIESGVNTLINPSIDQDEGWKKIKRVKVRHELFDRLDRTLSPIIGRVRCDADGIANVIKLGMDVMEAMYRENKIEADYTFIEDPERPHAGDSAWFLISCNDLDALEKIYLSYTFRYSSNA